MRKENHHTFSDTTIRWLNSKPGLTDASRMAYKGEINRLTEHLAHTGVRHVSAVSRNAWWDYLNSLEKKRTLVETKRCEELSLGSIHQARRITRDFFMWALDEKIISWLPRLPDVAIKDGEPEQDQEERSVMDTRMARILVGDVESSDVREYRAHMVFNLIFWAALKPAALAALRVRDFSDTGILSVMHSSPQRQVVLPDHVVHLWKRYRKNRREVIGSPPKMDASLISHLENEDAISAWGVWSIFNEWYKSHPSPNGIKMTPRDLRIAYLDFLCSESEAKLQLACAHGGMREKRIKARNGGISKGMLREENGQVLVYLKTL